MDAHSGEMKAPGSACDAPSGSGPGSGERGQTTLDFAVGMSVFMGIVLFMFLFVPGILDPFTVGSQDETITSNRVADAVVQSLLASPERPNDLSTGCTILFFEQAPDGGPAVEECGIEGENLTEFVGVGEFQQLNVTVLGNVSSASDGSDPVCWDGDGEGLVERDDAPGDCDVFLAAGDQLVTNNQDSVTSVRVGALAGDDVTVHVEMW